MTFELKRDLGSSLLQTYLPTLFIVVISWISFWIDPTSSPSPLPQRGAVGYGGGVEGAGAGGPVCHDTSHPRHPGHGDPASAAPRQLCQGPSVSPLPIRWSRRWGLQALDVWFGVCMIFLFGVLLEFAIVNMFQRLAQDNASREHPRPPTCSPPVSSNPQGEHQWGDMELKAEKGLMTPLIDAESLNPALALPESSRIFDSGLTPVFSSPFSRCRSEGPSVDSCLACSKAHSSLQAPYATIPSPKTSQPIFSQFRPLVTRQSELVRTVVVGLFPCICRHTFQSHYLFPTCVKCRALPLRD